MDTSIAISTTTDNLIPFTEAQRIWSARHRRMGGRNLPCCDLDGILTASGQIIEGIWMEYDNCRPVLIYDLADDAPDRKLRRRAMRNLADRAGIPAVTICARETGERDNEGDSIWTYRIVARNAAALKWIADGSKTMSESELIVWLYALRDRQPDVDLQGVAAERNDWRDERLPAMFRAIETAIPPHLSDCTGGDSEAVVAVLEAKKSPACVNEGAANTRALRSLAKAAAAAFVPLQYSHRAAVAGDEEFRELPERWEFRDGRGWLTVEQMATRLVIVPQDSP